LASIDLSISEFEDFPGKRGGVRVSQEAGERGKGGRVMTEKKSLGKMFLIESFKEIFPLQIAEDLHQLPREETRKRERRGVSGCGGLSDRPFPERPPPLSPELPSLL
jgi:hypothetical protein